MYFPFDRRVLKSSYDASNGTPPESNDYEIKKFYAYYRIRIDHQQLTEVDQYIKENNLCNELFADPAPQRLVHFPSFTLFNPIGIINI